MKKTNNDVSISRLSILRGENKSIRVIFRIPVLLYTLLSLGLAIILSFNLYIESYAQDQSASFGEVRSLETNELGIHNPVGLTFSPQGNVFYVLEAHSKQQSSIITMTPFEDIIDTMSVNTTLTNPINMTFNPLESSLLLLDSGSNELIEIKADADGLLDPRPDSIIRYPINLLGLQDPQGLTVDPLDGNLYILDSAAQEILRIAPNSQGGFDGLVSTTDNRISRLDLSQTGPDDPRGLAMNPDNGHLYFMSPGEQFVYELTWSGQLVATFDLSPMELIDPQNLVFALSGDLTDDPNIWNLYIADSGSTNWHDQASLTPLTDQTSTELENSFEFQIFLPMSIKTPVDRYIPQRELGRIIELTLSPEAQITTLAANFTSTLVQTIDASAFSPPSPDSSGITYLSNSNSLLISDSEVNEMPIYAGVNMFRTTLSGGLSETFTTLSYSNEPTGVTVNPSNQHLFISDDTGTRSVYELNPGPDGIYETADDIVTSFSTETFGSNDPEGVTFDPSQGVLFIVDGVNNEVYRVSPGDNGLFDGVGDEVTNFDTAQHGILDPEGITINPATGNLYIVGEPTDTLAEMTTSGDLVQTIDISAANATKPAGLVYAPSSQNQGEWDIYVAARGVDNNSDPNENDGKVYELTMPSVGPAPPIANDDSANTTIASAVTIDVAANDSDPNNNLDPTSVNNTCTSCTDPSDGSLINNGNGSFDYTPNPSFLGEDSFIYQICDTDLLCDTATVTISVGNVNTTVDVRVAASSDDAEEDPSGNIDLNSSDLELVLESSIQTVGMRFNGISIPQGATISSAYIQFQADETNSEPTTLSIQGQLVVNAPTFSSTNGDISNRTKTTAAVSWNPVPWTIRNEAGPNQQTPDIAPVIQAIVNQSGWSDGNSLVIIITGSGKRVVEAYDGVSTAAPLLHVEFTSGPPNNPPTAVDDTGSVAEGGTLNQAVPGILDNDSDPDNDPLTISTTPVTPPTNGSLTLGTDGSYTYSHDGSETTADSFVYEVCDTGSLCDTATVSITITPVNDPPVANAGGPYSGVVGVSLPFDASASSDVDGTISTYSWNFGDGNNGTGVNPTHTYATTGDYSVQLTVTDNGGESSTDITTASISAEPNNPPTAVDDTGSVAEGDTLNQAAPGILDNDSDPDSNPLIISTTPVTPPTNGSLTLGTDGSYTYTHDGSETTADSFVYEVCDTGSLCDTATISITITPVNDPPVTTDDSGTVTKGGTLNPAAPGILDNDSDPENDPLTITTTPITPPSNGSLTLNANGSYTYTHDGSETTSDSFVYEVCDTEPLCDTATVLITIQSAVPQTIEVRVNASSDDAEEDPSGNIDLNSSDLELVLESSIQTVGMRFNNITIPQGAAISNAYIQFQADETNSEPTTLSIQGQLVVNAPTFSSTNGDISNRTRTSAAVSWNPEPWTIRNIAGPNQQTPDITPVIQEILNQSGWSDSNSLVIIITGSGKRVVEAYDGVSTAAPLLHVEYYSSPPTNQAPTVDAGQDQTIILPNSAILNGTVSDDGLPNPPGSVTTSWTKVSGPGTVTFADSSSVDTTASFFTDGLYVLSLTADDGLLTTNDEVTITVSPADTNQAPTVDAGQDQTITLLNGVNLDGTVIDDGLPDPPGLLTITWSMVNGPGTVTFADSNAVDTTASFSTEGLYTLLLTADDSELTVSDEVTITVVPASIIQVPQDQPTIQGGINAAQDGDLVLVSPGTYSETLTISGKTITLASLFHTTQDSSYIDQTIIDGGGATVITVAGIVGSETKIIGFTIQNGVDGISADAKLDILHNRFTGHSDAIDYEGGGGICSNNVFEYNSDDAVDLDGSTEAIIENNIIRNNGDDGIEVRLHDYTGPILNIIIRDNIIVNNDEDGIQLIDYPGLSDRFFLIERNLIEANAMVGLGLMDNGVTTEDYRAASIPEPIHLFNNTFIDNDHGLTGGDNLLALNNLFVNSTNIGIKGVDGSSIAAFNLFWNNGIDIQTSNFDTNNTLFDDPLLDVNHELQLGSPAIDAGTAFFQWGGETVLDMQSNEYFGLAPDIGMYESSFNQPPSVNAGVDQATMMPNGANLSGVVADDGLPNPPGVFTTTWSKVSGPGSVTFTDPNAVETTASFSRDGDYVLRLTADDGELTSSDEVTINVSFRFVSWADTKSALDDLAALSNQALPLTPVLTIYEGDLESDGFTLSGMNAWKDAMNGYANNGMFDKSFPVRGNHDSNDAPGWQSYYDMATTAQNIGAVNYSALNEDLTYSFDYGSAHFIGVDVLGSASNLSSEQVNWIDADLSAAEARGLTHAFIYFHGPIYCVDGHCSCTTRICSISSIVMDLINVINQHPIVTATFHGHEHTYAYVHLDETRIPGITHPFEQFITGSAGAGPSDCIPGRTDYCMPSHGFVTVDISGNDFSVDFYQLGTTSPVQSMTFTKSGNQPPSVYAGPDQTVTLPEDAVLDGTVTDDGTPSPPNLIPTWSVESGPGTVTFGDENAVDTTASFSINGVYVLRLTADDGELSSFDELSITVNPQPPTNQPPIVSAGQDQTITLPSFASLDGTVTDDGLPTPSSLTTTWSVESGPGTVSFGDESAVDTTASFSTDGEYVLRLTADDGALTNYDEVTITVNAQPPTNQPPTVNAGQDQTISLPNNAALDGTVTDDGLPSPPNLTTTWSVVSGPGTVTFGDANAVDTTASFSTNSTYILRLTANDGEMIGVDDVTITVVSQSLVSLDIRVSASSDDAEEKLSSGRVSLTSSDLEMVIENEDQIVGMRFSGVAIPPGATITKAYIQFKVDETNNIDPSLLQISGEKVTNATTFVNSTYNISNRLLTGTSASVDWSPNPWTTKGVQGPDQQTSDITPVIQEIVDQTGWTAGNSLVIIITGGGKRVAESYNGDQAGAPLLHVEYTTGPPNLPPTANNDSAETPEDSSVTIDVAANDSDPDGTLNLTSTNTTCAACSGPSNGSLVNNDDGTFLYDPSLDYHGPDSFTYEICDNNGACNTATADITVTPVADSPVANDDNATTQENNLVTIDAAANDTDPDGDLNPTSSNTTCTTCTEPPNGSLVNNGNGTFDYTPNPNYNGPDSFTYEICDLGGRCDTATVYITVTMSNDPPVASDDNADTQENSPVTIDVAANDSDIDGNLDISSVNTTCTTCSEPSNGSLVNNGDGTFEYTPNPNYNGTDDFIYEICDTLNACDTALVNITIHPVDYPPVADDDFAIMSVNNTVTIDVAVNDTDPDGDLDPTTANTTCATCSSPANGSLVNNGNGTFDYTPSLDYTGPDSFVYEICDLGGLCATATVYITVNPATPETFEVRVAASSDDAEEDPSGNIDLNSSDLELVLESSIQTVGMRFNGISIPQGATISSAYIQFQVDETNNVDPSTLYIGGEKVPNASTFTSTTNDITNRNPTDASVEWSPNQWTSVGVAGPDQQTPNIAAVIEEIVGQAGWTADNSLVIIIDGEGKRVAEAFDGVQSGAPLLHVEYYAIPMTDPGSGLEFTTNSGTYVTFGDPAKLDLTTFTIETWFKRTGTGTTSTTGSGGIPYAIPLVTHGAPQAEGSNEDANWVLVIDDAADVIAADFEDMAVGTNHPVYGVTPITNDIWHHAAATWDGNAWRLYLDGKLETTLAVSALPRFDTTQHAALGTMLTTGEIPTPNGYFQGVIDEARVWNRALTQTEILTNINQEITSGTGLVARWGLNEGMGMTVVDSITPAANGTIAGSNYAWVPGAPFDLDLDPGTPTLVAPADGATGVSTSATLTVNVDDARDSDLTVSFYGRIKNVAPGADFTLIAIPDPQYYASSYPSIYNAQMDWVVAEKLSRNIKYVMSLGDNVNTNNSTTEWNNAVTAWDILTAGSVPYGLALGNHDGAPSDTANFNAYFGTRVSTQPTYAGRYGTSDYDNTYATFSASGMDFIVLFIEYDSDMKSTTHPVLVWANSVLQANPTRRAIVVTHDLLDENSYFTNQGSAIYNALKENPNLFLMLGGHWWTAGQRTDVYNGHTVYSLRSDYQVMDDKQSGYLRAMRFSPTDGQIHVSTYSPTQDKYLTDTANQFDLAYAMDGVADFSLIDSTTVPSGSDASVTWSGLIGDADYEWYAVADNGGAAAASSTWSFTTTTGAANHAPVVTNPGAQSNSEGNVVSLQIEASDEDLDTLTCTASGLPEGLSIDSATGLISGTINYLAANNSPYSVTITVDDGSDLTSEIFSWSVVQAASGLCGYDASLVGCWPMEEGSGTTLIDATSFGNDGNITGVPTWVAGYRGQALNLSGTGQYAIVVDDNSLDISNAITLAAWIRPGKTGTQNIIKKTLGTTTANGYELSLSSSGKVFVRLNGNAAYRIDSTTSYPINGTTWMHVATTFDGATIRLYINGVQEGFKPGIAIGTNNTNLGIGAEPAASPINFFQGALDEVRIYNRALSLSEIEVLAGIAPPQFSCLSQQGPLINLSGVQNEIFNKRWDPLAENTRIDAHSATWTALWPVQDQFNYPIRFAGGPNICFSGGTIQGNYPEQIGSDSHSTWDYMHSTTGLMVYADSTTIEGTRIYNYGDGINFNYGPSGNFIIKGVHLSHIRDDCVQNDWLYSGLIDDSLFDGCYSAFSARTYLGQDPPAHDGSNNLWTIQNSLIRLEPMWGVYKNRGLIPGHDGWFKWDSSGISPRLALHNNIFRVDQDANNVGLGIPSGKLESCSNNTVVWLGSGPYPDPLPTTFNNQPCFTITTDLSVWDNAVADWLSIH